ncbi:MAG: hypothetical protein HOY78_05745 [Saccharothrix sp.]|nr:hypothetical protein [Saccharothrix sp.]
MTAWLLGIAGAVILGAAGNLAYDLAKHQTLRLPRFVRARRELPAAARAFDPVALGMHPLVTWSRRRRLREGNLRTVFVGRRSGPHLLSRSDWHAKVAAERRKGTAGSTAYLVGLRIDHGEHPAAHEAVMTIAESDYAECVATMEVAGRSPGELTTKLWDGLDGFLTVVPPTLLFASVAVLADSGRLLCLRRSIGVRTAPGTWTLGINETMKYEAEPGREEDLFGLVRRGLREELGLEPSEYGEVIVTWLGWSSAAAGFLAVAIVRARLSEAEIERRRGECHSVYEHDGIAWLPVTRRSIANVVLGGPSPDRVHPWITELSPLVAGEVWRFRHVV